jgi:hypothetical protein
VGHESSAEPKPSRLNKNYEVGILQGETGLSYLRVEDFIEWLQNPENTRYEEWENAGVAFNVYDDPELLPKRKSALFWLKAITGQTFDSQEKWLQWWQANRSKLVLSQDGIELVSR